jgi:hypothetical protein
MGDTSTLAWVSEAVTELAANPKVSKSWKNPPQS